MSGIDPVNQWCVIGHWPTERTRPYISFREAHFWQDLGAVCGREDFGSFAPAPANTPRCAECVRRTFAH